MDKFTITFHSDIYTASINKKTILSACIQHCITDCATTLMYGFSKSIYDNTEIKEALEAILTYWIGKYKRTMIILSDSNRNNQVYDILDSVEVVGFNKTIINHNVTYGQRNIKTLIFYK